MTAHAPDARPLVRVSKKQACPVCDGHKGCGVRYGDDGKPELVLCIRVSDGSRSTAKNGAFVHVLRRSSRPREFVLSLPKPLPNLDRRLAELRAHPTNSLDILTHEAGKLGVPVEALQALDAFHYVWRGDGGQCKSCVGFPMRSPLAGNRCVGIRVRGYDGGKWSEKGGTEGLFLPTTPLRTDPVFLTEGPTDCAAVLSVGLSCIGRPSAIAGDQVVAMLRHVVRKRRVVILAENDRKPNGQWPGRDGAEKLAQVLPLHASEVRVVYPPLPFKDARDWVRAGATRQDLLQAAAAAQPVRLAGTGDPGRAPF